MGYLEDFSVVGNTTDLDRLLLAARDKLSGPDFLKFVSELSTESSMEEQE